METLTKVEREHKREDVDRESMLRGSRVSPNGNDGPCVLEFNARGIPLSDIDTFGPNQNVRTYRAWRALGRQVRKGEKSVKLCVWMPILDKEPIRPDSKERHIRSRPVTACVFHVSQTDAVNGKRGAS